MLISADFLKRANELVKFQVHPTNVTAGFRMAYKEAMMFLKENYVVKIDSLGEEGIV